MSDTKRLTELDHAHVWHPFTPMDQWRQADPLIIERAEGVYLFDTEGRRYIDGTSSLWCNVHGHRVPAIDQAVRDQLGKVAHSTLLGLGSPPSIELAARLCEIAGGKLNKVFYSDSGATAVEVAFKMAVGYWYHQGRPDKNRFIGLRGAYHGDTTGAMSVGFSELLHRPFASMVFPTSFMACPDACRLPPDFKGQHESSNSDLWPSEDPDLGSALRDHCLGQLESMLERQANETAAVVVEPVMQGAVGMICQPAGFLRGVADLTAKYNVLLIADEVATGFGRTGRMFACEHEGVEPDVLCLAKGISGGYLPLAATLVTGAVEQAFCGGTARQRTFYHGHTYTGNPLACAAALASLSLFHSTKLLEHIRASAAMIGDRLNALRHCPHVLDVRQRGLMVGIELCDGGRRGQPIDFARPTGAAVCWAMRSSGLILRPLGDVVVLMPIPATPHDTLGHMLDIVVQTIGRWHF